LIRVSSSSRTVRPVAPDHLLISEEAYRHVNNGQKNRNHRHRRSGRALRLRGDIFTCVGGIFALGDALERLGYELVRVWQWLSVPESICTTLAFIAVPVVFYFLLVHGRKEADGEEEASEEEEEASDASEE
jgi:hypothetical protein